LMFATKLPLVCVRMNALRSTGDHEFAPHSKTEA
jgi:hypothetical protein